MAPAATSRLATVFAERRRRGERALVAYLTAGDPSLADTRRLVRAAAARGADIVELGVPFSDPIADGPVIQRAAMRALARGTSVARVLERSEEHTSELQSRLHLVCRLLLEKKKKKTKRVSDSSDMQRE